MTATLNILTILMAHALQWKDGCRLFALIQTMQLLEIGPMPRMANAQWMFCDQANIAVELGAVVSTKDLRIARALMMAHALLKCLRYSDIDCLHQLLRNPLYWTIWALNLAIIFVLLAYAFDMPILRLRSYSVRKAYAASYAPA